MKGNSDSVHNRILVVDDNPSIHEDIRKILGNSPAEDASIVNEMAFVFGEAPVEPIQTQFDIDSAFQGQEGLAKVEEAEATGRPYSMAFIDVRMPPGWDGVETIKRIWQNHSELQIVICTAYSDYSWQEMIREIGRSDGLVILKKPFDNIELLQLAHALTEKWRLYREVKTRLQALDQLVSQRTTELQSSNEELGIANEQLRTEIAERIQLEKRLHSSEERLCKAFMVNPVPMAIRSLPSEEYVDVNESFLEGTGLSRQEVIGRTPKELDLWESPDTEEQMMSTLRERKAVRNLSCRLKTKSRQTSDILVSAELFELARQPYVLLIAQDTRGQIQWANQFRHTQKTEGVGWPATGD